MDIPPKVRIPLCIEQGCVYNFHLDVSGPGRQSKNRYFVVLNRNPKTDTILLLVTSTTQVSKRLDFVKRAGISERTIVSVSPNEYRTFTSESAFNCNDIIDVDMDTLIRKVEENGSMNYPKLPDSIIEKLIAGVNESPRVAEAFKKMI